MCVSPMKKVIKIQPQPNMTILYTRGSYLAKCKFTVTSSSKGIIEIGIYLQQFIQILTLKIKGNI